MNKHDATEAAYKNGYQQGMTNAVLIIKERLHEQFHDRVAYTRSYVHDTIDQTATEMLKEEAFDDDT